ncbi:MAG: hypothetical protein GX444_06550 [Myxococcales bacterium]|nr:hypothetical protein [Myxococcales bacterium]
MKRIVLSWMLVLALLWLGVYACGDDDDDNDDNDDAAADDDNAADDDTGDDDDVTIPPEAPYDPADCAAFVAEWYEECHFDLSVDNQPLTAAEAQANCEDYQMTFWICALECYEFYGSDCVELFECVNQCAAE